MDVLENVNQQLDKIAEQQMAEKCVAMAISSLHQIKHYIISH